MTLVAQLDEINYAIGVSYSRRPRVSCAGIEVVATRRSDAIVCSLCRRLLEAGHDPVTALEVYRADTLALWIRSLGEAARLTVREDGVRFARAMERQDREQDRVSAFGGYRRAVGCN